MSAELRPLGQAEIGEVADVHVAAFPDSALSRLGRGAVRRYYDWQMNGPHESVSIGAFLDQSMIGFFVGGTFQGSLSGFVRRNAGFLALRLLARPWLVFAPEFRSRMRLGMDMLRTAPPSAGKPPRPAQRPASFGILSVCTHPAARGQGVGEQLMREAERLARVRGFAGMHLTVHESNAGAIRLYERLGWSREQGTETRSSGGVTFIKRLSPIER